MSKEFNIAIVGATGAVGVEFLRIIQERKLPVKHLILLASARSVGKEFLFQGSTIQVQELTHESFSGVDIALFSAGSSISKEYALSAISAGAVVVDNSSAFRMDNEVPLVVPEINASDILKHRGIIANPNCTTAICVMALYPLHLEFGLKRVFASSYQAVSGTGAKAISELGGQIEAITKGEAIKKEVYPHQIAFNVLPHVDSFLASGYTKEEMKLQNEGRKIMHLPDFQASITCVRVPVYRAHSAAVTAEFEQPVDLDRARAAIERFPGVCLRDDVSQNLYPTPLDVSGTDDCQVGRLRKDCVLENGLSFWVVGDQLLKGAALNAVQIAEKLLQL